MSDFKAMFDEARESLPPVEANRVIPSEMANAIRSFLDAAQEKGVIDRYTCSPQSQQGSRTIIQHIIHGVKSKERYKAVNRTKEGDFYLTLVHKSATDTYGLDMRALGSDAIIKKAAKLSNSIPINHGSLVEFKLIDDPAAQEYLKKIAHVLAVSERYFKTAPIVAKRGGRVPGL